jgi:short subunit dehydrogenase-like uncharacterized protein
VDRSQRRFHIVLWGATGYTGSLVAEALAKAPSTPKLSWALAGRDRGKLEAVRRDLTRIDPALAELPILVGDASDRASLEKLAAETRVVCTTVGPYARYGNELVAACVAQGTDYCDLTGEVQWMRRTIDAHHEEAGRTGARIVHTCGFDSLPSDLGVAMLQDYARRVHGRPAQKVTALFGEMSGGASGGTIASMLIALDEAKHDREARRALGDPYGLDPKPRRGGPDGSDSFAIGFDDHLKSFTAPFVMASVNTRVVRRSNAVMEYAYGTDFEYRELMSTGRGAAGLARAASVVAGLGGFIASLQVPPLKKLVTKRLPKPGEGPTPEQRAKGHYVLRLFGDLPNLSVGHLSSCTARSRIGWTRATARRRGCSRRPRCASRSTTSPPAAAYSPRPR